MKDYTKPIELDDTQCHFTPDPGKVVGPVNCGVCGEQMKERRNVNGPRGFVMAMIGSKSLHDSFDCPFSQDEWHIQVVRLREEGDKSVSARIEAIYRDEAEEVLKTRTATKKTSKYRF